MYFGGNSELRGYDYLQFAGQNVVFANAELRFPLIEAALTPIGVIGGIRGVFFADIGGALVQQPAVANPCTGDRASSSRRTTRDLPVVTGYQTDRAGSRSCTIRSRQHPDARSTAAAGRRGFRLQDGRASYGVGLETFALGFPIHFDWSWRTLFNKDWEDVVFAAAAAAAAAVPQAAVRGLDRLRLLADVAGALQSPETLRSSAISSGASSA